MIKKTLKLIQSLWDFMYVKNVSELEEVSEDEYLNTFIRNRSKEEIEASYNKAWEAKNFEIENYWKRAAYFWAFQVASFAGYFTVLGSLAYSKNPQVLYFVICIGFITSLAWALINKGSKTWQRHWEKHVDMLEDQITGPLYKIVTTNRTYSVSKINEIVSRFFVFTWFILAGKYLNEHISLHWTSLENIDWQIIFSTSAVVYFVLAMFIGYGRGRFGRRRIVFYRRKFTTDV